MPKAPLCHLYIFILLFTEYNKSKNWALSFGEIKILFPSTNKILIRDNDNAGALSQEWDSSICFIFFISYLALKNKPHLTISMWLDTTYLVLQKISAKNTNNKVGSIKSQLLKSIKRIGIMAMVEKPKQNITNHISIFDLNTIVPTFLNCATNIKSSAKVIINNVISK